MARLIMVLVTIVTIASCAVQKDGIIAPEKSNIYSASDRQLIMSNDGDSPMRVFKIDKEADSLLLRMESKYVIPDSNDVVLKTFVERLYATVRDSISMGVGIAAPQVGILKRVIWIQRFDKEGFPFEVYLNPRVIKYTEKKQDCREGCLSIPDRSDTTRYRAYAIHIEYDRMDETHHSEMVEGFTAVIFQHEIDHLYGKLYIDQL